MFVREDERTGSVAVAVETLKQEMKTASIAGWKQALKASLARTEEKGAAVCLQNTGYIPQADLSYS